MNKNKTELPLSFTESIHKDGKIWGFTLFAVIMLFPFIMCLVFQCVPNWAALGKGLLAVMPMYWAVAIIEVITYTPMLYLTKVRKFIKAGAYYEKDTF